MNQFTDTTFAKHEHLPLFAKARRKDPITSHAAADRMNESGSVQNHHARIIAVLEQATQGLTPKEIAVKSGLEYHQVQRRLKELELKIGWDGIRDGQRVWGII